MVSNPGELVTCNPKSGPSQQQVSNKKEVPQVKTRLKYAVVALAALLVVSLVVCGGMTVPVAAAGTTYYVDCAGGDDGAAGTSTGSAWRTTTRANQQTYGPGDSILFKRGTVCSGEGFKPTGNGTVAEPITIADYGSGALPQIDGVGEHEPAILLRNVQNYVVRNLDLTQHGQPTCVLDDRHKIASCPGEMIAILHIEGRGPLGVQACGEPCTTRNVELDNLVVHDGQWNGVFISGGRYDLDHDTYGFVDNVLITNVESYSNWKNGIEASCTYYKTPIYTTTNVQTFDSYLHDNGGDGVVYGPVAYGLIDGVEASYNGQLIDARLGAWMWDSLDVTIQFSESHHNMTPQQDGFARDGGGFDIDLGTVNGMIQYSWSHDNEGEGFLLMTWPIGYGWKRGVTYDAQMRYNIGERDAQKLASSIMVFGGVDPGVIYNNTIYYVAMRDNVPEMFGAYGAPLITSIWGKSGNPVLHTYNNIFVTDGTVYPEYAPYSYNLMTDGKGDFFFDNNIWWRVEGGLAFDWNGTLIDTWAGWQAMGFDPNGMNADPMVVGPLGGGPGAYALQAGSPAIDAGREVTEALQGMGDRDYFGNAIPQGTAYDIGAYEYGGGPPPPPTDTPIPTDTPEPPPTNTPGGPTDTPEPPTATPGGGTNLALSKPTETSSVEGDAVGANAVDGDMGTIWRSKKQSQLPSEWIKVDLEGVYTIDQVVLRWSAFYATEYTIQVSENGSDWSTVYSTSSGDGGDDVVSFAATDARYVMMDSTNWNNQSERCWLPEYEVYGGGGPSPTDTPVPPTDTPVPPTDTPVPPTDTPEPGPTDTPAPPPTDTPIPPTDTPAPPTDTPVPPTDTPIPPTDTPVPPTDTPGPGDLPFFDGFEDGDVLEWSTVGSAWAEPGAAYQGSYGARMKLEGSSMWRTISTAGYTDIHLKYVGRGRDLDEGEYLLVEWYDGSTWTVIDNGISGPDWVVRDWTLPASAADNPDFAVRFTCHADKNTEWVDFDNVEVTGQ
jgi:hypothetical protein